MGRPHRAYHGGACQAHVGAGSVCVQPLHDPGGKLPSPTSSRLAPPRRTHLGCHQALYPAEVSPVCTRLQCDLADQRTRQAACVASMRRPWCRSASCKRGSCSSLPASSQLFGRHVRPSVPGRTIVAHCCLEWSSGTPNLILATAMLAGMRQVELANVRSFYKSDEKSPFKNFPWKTGTMHFHYLSVRVIPSCQALTFQNVMPSNAVLCPPSATLTAHVGSMLFPSCSLPVPTDDDVAGSGGAASQPAGGAACASQGHGGHRHLLLSVHTGCCPRILRIRATVQVRNRIRSRQTMSRLLGTRFMSVNHWLMTPDHQLCFNASLEQLSLRAGLSRTRSRSGASRSSRANRRCNMRRCPT